MLYFHLNRSKKSTRYSQKDATEEERVQLDVSNNGRIRSEAIKNIKKQLKRLQNIPNVSYLCAIKTEMNKRKRKPFVAMNGSLKKQMDKYPELLFELGINIASTKE